MTPKCINSLHVGTNLSYNSYMLNFYRDHAGHIACVHYRQDHQVRGITSASTGLQCFTMSEDAFMRKYTHPVKVDTSKAMLSWYGRALKKRGNDPRALNVLKEFVMENANMEEMTMDEIIAEHNKLATELGKPTVGTFKSLKAARAALERLQTPAEPKAIKEGTSGAVARGPVQGIGVFAKDLIVQGFSNKEVLTAVLDNYPTAKTSVSCIAYYRSKLVLAGKLPRSARGEAKAKQMAGEAPEAVAA